MAGVLRPAWHKLGRIIVPLAAAITLLVVFIGPARAGVAQLSGTVFELDGNASTTHGAGLPDDWDRVCHQKLGTDCSISSDTTGASAVAFASQPVANAHIFTGGGSKDPNDLSSWLWKSGTGGLPGKDILQDAFSARYSVPSSPDCPVLNADGITFNTDGTKTCQLLYFGMDRFDNSGDAQLGFWFFQNPVQADGPSSQGGNTFTDGSGNPASHKDGDVLILSDFSVGGTTATINLYKWVTSGGDVSTHLQSLGGSTSANCATTSGSFCGIVNTGPNNTTSPWPFTDKSGNKAFAPGEFYEGGVNLSSFPNLGGECFASFLSESRSSTSPTATLKDFILGGFGACTSSITTAQNWTPNDSATIGVTGTSGAWNGTVTFTLYPNASCNTADTPVYGPTSALAVSNSSPTAATSNTTTSVNATGTTNYSWQVDFHSLTNGVPDSSSCSETTALTIANS
jgi:hypothetical protein